MTQNAGFDLLDDQGALLGNDRFIGPGYTAIPPIPGSEDELVLPFTSTTGATTGIRGLGFAHSVHRWVAQDLRHALREHIRTLQPLRGSTRPLFTKLIVIYHACWALLSPIQLSLPSKISIVSVSS